MEDEAAEIELVSRDDNFHLEPVLKPTFQLEQNLNKTRQISQRMTGERRRPFTHPQSALKHGSNLVKLRQSVGETGKGHPSPLLLDTNPYATGRECVPRLINSPPRSDEAFGCQTSTASLERLKKWPATGMESQPRRR